MKKAILLLSVLFYSGLIISQNKIEWHEEIELKLEDFKSESSQIGDINIYSLRSSTSIGFNYHMTNGEFMFTKNFNKMVSCEFDIEASSLIAPDSVYAQSLLSFANYEFDLTELHCRLFRKELYERKKAFSPQNFYQPIYDEINRIYARRHGEAAKLTDIGRNNELLEKLHQEVKSELLALSDFCKNCTPPKKRKK